MNFVKLHSNTNFVFFFVFVKLTFIYLSIIKLLLMQISYYKYMLY
ncbi:hypothetical protein ABH942_000966 [Flavobacterium sp. 28YEA47A]